MRKLNLRQLILLLSVSTALLILANTFYTSHQTQRALLIEQTLEANQAYASKMAESVDNFLDAAQQQLAFAAQDVLLADNDPQALQHIVERLEQQTDSFSSVLIADPQGIALATTHSLEQFYGQQLKNAGAVQALKERKPLVSKPYISVTDRLVVFLTHPVFNAQGDYLGFIGGSIYLHEQSILFMLLGKHYHSNDSYIYAVDGDGRLIYHQDARRIGEVITGNKVIGNVMEQKTGSQLVLNSKGIQMLAGYAPVSRAGWGVVTQRSLEATLSGMRQQMLIVAQYSFPFFVLIVWLVWIVSRWISKPLWQLAHSAESLDKPDTHAGIVDVKDWYFEAEQLKRAMLNGLAGVNKKLGQLNLENMTDPLTGLMNRRGMQLTLDEWEQAQQSFSVIMGDIDHFKRVNDEFGHAVGDKVLQSFAEKMQALSRPGDVICRVGGEEFILLLPNADAAMAGKVAERLRARVADSVCQHVGTPVTISLGVASWPCGSASIEDVLENADLALYAAKQAGRNTVQHSDVVCD